VSLAREMRRLARHSAVYGIGGLVSRLVAVLLLPVYATYLGSAGFGKIETVVAATTVLVIVLRMGISSAFFRFYFDSHDAAHRTLVVRTSFWFTLTMATAGLAATWILAGEIDGLLRLGDDPWLVRAGAVALWAQMNYEQLTSLFRVEERSVAFLFASLGNVLLTIGATIVLVVVLDKGPTGAVVGNFTGTLTVYLVLLAYRRYQLGLQFDRSLLREMNRFGLPLVPSALALWAINFVDRIFIAHFKDQAEVGVYSVAVRISSAIVFLMIAFRTAWPAFAYSIEDDAEAKRTYAFVLTYLVVVASWLALALGLLAPWLVRLLTQPEFYEGERVVAPLAFGGMAYAAYIVMAIGVGRAKRTQFNWVITGFAAVVNVALNLILIPPYGIMGAAVATVASYVVMFLGMTWYAQRVFPTPYQWRRVLTAVAAALALLLTGRALGGLAVALALSLAYPLALLLLGFFLPEERSRLRAGRLRT
jgi:O-antigen/teichoic acid export membrane protein